MTNRPDRVQLTDANIYSLQLKLEVLRRKQAVCYPLAQRTIKALAIFLSTRKPEHLDDVIAAYHYYMKAYSWLYAPMILLVMVATLPAGMVEIPDQQFGRIWVRDITLTAASDVSDVYVPRVPVPPRNPVLLGPMRGPIELTATVDGTGLVGSLDVVGGGRFEGQVLSPDMPYTATLDLERWTRSISGAQSLIPSRPTVTQNTGFENWPYGQTEMPMSFRIDEPVEVEYLSWFVVTQPLTIPEPGSIVLALFALLGFALYNSDRR